MWDKIWYNGPLATMAEDNGYGLIPDAAVAVDDGRIAWIGPLDELPGPIDEIAGDCHDLGGALLTPGLIDCHTHLVYSGNRAREFELRLEGASYEEIARAGGGILSTVSATRAASEDELFESTKRRLQPLLADGVTTIEIKSGYGLTVADEMKMLRAARRLEAACRVRVRTTFLGAHALPPEYADDRQGYIDLVCQQMIPAVAAAGLADAVDGFCENIAFTTGEMAQVFDAAVKYGLPVKLHAEQLTDQKGAVLAAGYKALSVDHLEYVAEDGVEAMADAGSVAVILPGAFYFLRETQLPPIDLFRHHGVAMALASDANPGSSPVCSLLLMLSMGCTFFRLTPTEALAGLTRHAATALGLAAEIGTLEIGKAADFAIWQVPEPATLAYAIADRPLQARVFAGELVA